MTIPAVQLHCSSLALKGERGCCILHLPVPFCRLETAAGQIAAARLQCCLYSQDLHG